MKTISTKEKNEIKKLVSLFPKKVAIAVNTSEDGGFFAEVKSFPGCFTEADNFSELIEMVNDAIKSYFEIPKKYSPYMPTYLPPISQVQKFCIFPGKRVEKNFVFRVPNYEEVACQY